MNGFLPSTHMENSQSLSLQHLQRVFLHPPLLLSPLGYAEKPQLIHPPPQVRGAKMWDDCKEQGCVQQPWSCRE